MKKNYSKPIALMETFTPNQFVASCTPEINEKYVVNPDKLVQGVHVKLDKLPYGVYDEDDAVTDFTSKSTHLTEMYYVGRGWGDADHHGEMHNWPTPPKTVEEMETAGFEWLYLFAESPEEPTGSVKVFGGTKIDEIIVNMS